MIFSHLGTTTDFRRKRLHPREIHPVEKIRVIVTGPSSSCTLSIQSDDIMKIVHIR